MICKNYEILSEVERIRLIGAVVHCIQNDNKFCETITYLLEDAKQNGILEGVKILPNIN